MQATIDIRLSKPIQLNQNKFERLCEIVQEKVSETFPDAIIRVRPSATVNDLSVFGLGKDAKNQVGEFLAELFENGSAFDELNDEYY